MAITILSKPTDALYYGYVPCYNNQWFVASSSQTASANFKYYIVVTDLLSGYSVTEKFLPNPSGKLQFDASKFSELLILITFLLMFMGSNKIQVLERYELISVRFMVLLYQELFIQELILIIMFGMVV